MKSICEKQPLEKPAVLFFMALSAGLITGDRFPGCFFTVFFVTVSAALLVWCVLHGSFRTLVLTVIGFIFLGYCALQPWVAQRLPPTDIKFFADGPRCSITGRVAGRLQHFGARTRFQLEVNTLNQKRVTGKLRVTAVGSVPDIAIGDTVGFKTRIKRIRNFNNPGAFNYRRYMVFKRVRVSAWVQGKRICLLQKSNAFSFKKRLGKLRSGLSGWIRGTLDSREGSIITALVTGDRSGISPGLRDQFNRLGIGHLLAISGLHMGIIAAVSFWGFNFLCRRVDFLLNAGFARRTAAFLTIFPVIVYGLVAGLSPSTRRAVIMVAIYLLSIILDRENDLLNTLAAAALIIVVLNPPSLFSVSFQLSFMAVLAIVYGFSCLPERWLKPLGRSGKVWHPAWLAGKLAAFFWVSFFAIAGTLPLSMHYFNQVSFIGVFTNFIYIPVVGFVTVPLALAAAVLVPVSGTAAAFFLKTAGAPLGVVMDLADRLSGLKWISAHTVTLNWFEMICLFSLMAIALQLVKPAKESATGSNSRNAYADTGRAKRIIRRWLIPVMLILTMDAAYWMNHRVRHRDLRVTCIDVRQGSSALLEFPGGKTMLIDGGGYSDNTTFDMGARVVAPFLWNRKILTVDTLVLTHPNSDHLNGLLYIAETFNIGEIWTNAETAETAGYRRLMKTVRERGIKQPAYKALPREFDIGGVAVSLLYPPKDFLTRKKTELWRNLNNNSIVVKAEFEGVTFLFTGDIMARAEKELVRLSGKDLKSTVLFVPHHGSNSSSSEIFLHQVKPAAAIISAGRGNRYKFPQKAVLKRYRDVGCRVYRTDRQGAIRITACDGTFRVHTMID